MKFIIPQNYNFKNKILGILDYSTAIFIIIWCVIIFGILQIFIKNWDIKIFLFISLSFPIILFSIVGMNGEPVIYVLQYMLKYIFRPKLYLYKKFWLFTWFSDHTWYNSNDILI